MPTRIAICIPCAQGQCTSCTALRPGADHDPLKSCVCRHTEAPRVSRETMLPTPPAPDHVVPPTSSPFDLEHALAAAREAGREEGYAAGYLAGCEDVGAENARRLADLEALGAALKSEPALLELQLAPTLVLVELDANGGLVQVLAAGDAEVLAGIVAGYDPPLPGNYVEAWPTGGGDPVDLGAPASTPEAAG